MKEQGDLQALIRTMNRSEKRYFKLNGGSGRFMELFDAIDKGRDLPKKGKENRSVTAKYLMDSLLQCLDAYHEKDSISSQIGRQIRYGAVLNKKGLHEQALKVFIKVEKTAYEHQDFIQLQQIYGHMRMLLAIGIKHHVAGLTVESVLERNHRAAEEIMLISRLRFVQRAFQKTAFETHHISKKTQQKLENLLDSEAMLAVNDESGIYSQVTAANIKGQFYHLTSNFEAGLKQSKMVFDLSYSHRKLLQSYDRMLLGSANNYMACCVRAEEFDEVKRVVDLIEGEKPQSESMEIMRLEAYYSNLLVYHLGVKQFEDDDLLPSVEKKMKEVGPKLNQAFLMLIYVHCSHYAFFRKDMSEALKWINLFLNHENRHSFKKALSIAFDYRLIIYYEQNKFDLIKNHLRLKNDSKEQTNDFPLTRQILRKFLTNELKKSKHRPNLTALRKDLLELKTSDTKKEEFTFFPFDEWVETKMAVKRSR